MTVMRAVRDSCLTLFCACLALPVRSRNARVFESSSRAIRAREFVMSHGRQSRSPLCARASPCQVGPGHGRESRSPLCALQHTATHCNTLQHTATLCNTLQHTGDSHGRPYVRVPHPAGSVTECESSTRDRLFVEKQAIRRLLKFIGLFCRI